MLNKIENKTNALAFGDAKSHLISPGVTKSINHNDQSNNNNDDDDNDDNDDEREWQTSRKRDDLRPCQPDATSRFSVPLPYLWQCYWGEWTVAYLCSLTAGLGQYC